MTDALDLVTLAEAKTFLNITDTSADSQLAMYITSASTMWQKRGGPGNSTSAYDEWYDGGSSTISLRHRPIVTVTSVTECITSTLAYTLTEQIPGAGTSGAWGYTIDKTLGTIVRRANGVAVATTLGTKNIHVVYTAGYATVPADVKLAVLMLINHQWDTQRGGTKRPKSGDEYDSRTTYSWPRRVEEIFQTYVIPGIA